MSELGEEGVDFGAGHGEGVAHNVYGDREAERASHDAGVVFEGVRVRILLVDQREDIAMARGMRMWETLLGVVGSTGGKHVGHPALDAGVDG